MPAEARLARRAPLEDRGPLHLEAVEGFAAGEGLGRLGVRLLQLLDLHLTIGLEGLVQLLLGRLHQAFSEHATSHAENSTADDGPEALIEVGTQWDPDGDAGRASQHRTDRTGRVLAQVLVELVLVDLVVFEAAVVEPGTRSQHNSGENPGAS